MEQTWRMTLLGRAYLVHLDMLRVATTNSEVVAELG
jgi:hypothetical protein